MAATPKTPETPSATPAKSLVVTASAPIVIVRGASADADKTLRLGSRVADWTLFRESCERSVVVETRRGSTRVRLLLRLAHADQSAARGIGVRGAHLFQVAASTLTRIERDALLETDEDAVVRVEGSSVKAVCDAAQELAVLVQAPESAEELSKGSPSRAAGLPVREEAFVFVDHSNIVRGVNVGDPRMEAEADAECDPEPLAGDEADETSRSVGTRERSESDSPESVSGSVLSLASPSSPPSKWCPGDDALDPVASGGGGRSVSGGMASRLGPSGPLGTVVSVGALTTLLTGHRLVRRRFLAGSRPAREHLYWRQWEARSFRLKIAAEPMGTETCVDDCLHAQILDAVTNTPRRAGVQPVLVLATGDGNSNGGNSSFPRCVRAALERGWKVEVWCWRATCSRVYLDFASSHPSLFSLRYLNDAFVGLGVAAEVLVHERALLPRLASRERPPFPCLPLVLRSVPASSPQGLRLQRLAEELGLCVRWETEGLIAVGPVEAVDLLEEGDRRGGGAESGAAKGGSWSEPSGLAGDEFRVFVPRRTASLLFGARFRLLNALAAKHMVTMIRLKEESDERTAVVRVRGRNARAGMDELVRWAEVIARELEAGRDRMAAALGCSQER